MKKSTSHSRGGGKLRRSKIVTVRLDPKLRYLAELAGRSQRRTLSSFVEWAVEDALSRVELLGRLEATTVAGAADQLWDVYEPDRFVRLASRFPALLTHVEQVLWKLIREHGGVWKGRYDQYGRWCFNPNVDEVDYEFLRAHWDKFVAVAKGSAEQSTLPEWLRERPIEP